MSHTEQLQKMYQLIYCKLHCTKDNELLSDPNVLVGIVIEYLKFKLMFIKENLARFICEISLNKENMLILGKQYS